MRPLFLLAIALATATPPAVAENCHEQMARMTSAQTMRLARCSFNLETRTPVDEKALTACRNRVVGHGLDKYQLKCLNFHELVEITYSHTDGWISDALSILRDQTDRRCRRRLGRAALIAWKSDIRFGPPWETRRNERRIDRLAAMALRVCGDDLGFWMLMTTIGDHRLDPDLLPAVER